ncbi:Beta-mannosidase B [Hypsizygus marmoreus]|uniref:Beta-mannosidase B n=1 Tax=Hypsizygus marmoreus TaxID=39966 RepID=A0A369J8R1_HYPMA|nr:Beta-mannosidase B [Hypsizygus marmoreus]
MRSNIEQAVADVLASKQEVIVTNVLTAYVRVAGFKHQSMDVLTAFERAMDKHPDAKDQVQSASAKLVAGLRQDYWKSMFNWSGKPHCCPCCEELVTQLIEDPDKVEESLRLAHETQEAPPKKSKKRRPKNKRPHRKPIAFDPGCYFLPLSVASFISLVLHYFCWTVSQLYYLYFMSFQFLFIKGLAHMADLHSLIPMPSFLVFLVSHDVHVSHCLCSYRFRIENIVQYAHIIIIACSNFLSCSRCFYKYSTENIDYVFLTFSGVSPYGPPGHRPRDHRTHQYPCSTFTSLIDSSTPTDMTQARIIQLNEAWSWKQRNIKLSSVLDELQLLDHGPASPVASLAVIQDGWTNAQAFPSEVHVELLKAGIIPDPYVAFNEHKVQWIGDAEWLYRCLFPFKSVGEHDHAELQFEGLDTICDVYLNGKQILSTDNMFRTYTYPISLRSLDNPLKETNTLLLHFKSAKVLAKLEEAKYGRVRAGSTNLGDPSRVYVRKAQYDWRWDWGPELLTCGPYRPVTLRMYTTRIKYLNPRTSVSFSSNESSPTTYFPILKLDLTLDGSFSQELVKGLRVLMRDSKGVVVREEEIPLPLKKEGSDLMDQENSELEVKEAVEWKFDNAKVGLWWPVGYGEQNLYDVEVTLLGVNDTTLDKQTKRVGFRGVQLIQEPLAEADQYGTGTTFLFEVNGVRIFAGGSNWIPADNFLTTITEERYRSWLILLRDGNQNMVRLWGGGVYEPDVFYDICDELGILVWQDFQFACGVYPAHSGFLENVKKEAEDNVRRLSHHPSLALFCGNNEDYQQVLQWGGIIDLPARIIYESVLPGVVSALTNPDAPIPYHRGSPYGGKEWDTSDPTVGDVHQWNIWGGKELPWQEYDRMGGRFVSEFGIPSFPSLRTVAHWMAGASEKEWYAQSTWMAQHTRAGSFERRFAILLNEGFRVSPDFETHVFTTQVLQSEALSYAYSSWRRQWRGPGKEYTSGVLVWQLNDCWPVTSWAIIDYFMRPKPAYYTIKRELAPFSIGISRTVIKDRENDRPRQYYEFGATQSLGATLAIWATNSTLAPLHTLTLELTFNALDPASPWSQTSTEAIPLLPANQATELLSLPCPGPPLATVEPPLWTSTYNVVVSARLITESGEVLARAVDWPQPFRYLEVPDPGVKVQVGVGGDAEMVQVQVERSVKCLFLSADGEGEEVVWSDNALDVVPDDPRVIVARGLGGRRIKAAWLGKEKASFV